MDAFEELELRKTNETPLASNYYHKTGEGDYQHGDLFMGVPAAGIHAVSLHHYESITESELDRLLASPIHDHRAVAVEILARLATRGPGAVREHVMEWYLKRLDRVNGWDLVDMSCPAVVGLRVAETKDFALLHRLVLSDHLWTKRVGIVSTLTLIRKGLLDETLAVLAAALPDDRDLIHKALGWMLREVGKRDRAKLDAFLKKNYTALPRTTLRYAIERHTETERKNILKGIFKEE
ncbi:MAG: DNA alkylation repair protein [Candidatus Izemoplasmatales bacterium]